MVQSADRFDLSGHPRGASRRVKHVISFGISLPYGQVEVKEIVSEKPDQLPWGEKTRIITVGSDDLIFSKPGEKVTNDFIVGMTLKPDNHFRRCSFSHGHGTVSTKRADMMFLKANEGAISEMRYFEVRIPRKEESTSVVENLFQDLQQALQELSSSKYSVTSRSQNVNSNGSIDVTLAALPASIDTRRTGGADFGPGFMDLPTDEKVKKIDKKIRDHVNDDEQLKECENMIEEFKQVAELDDAMGPLGNGNVTSQICRMNKEVPHEMLDLFLMMGRLRMQKRKEGVKKKRKWDIADF